MYRSARVTDLIIDAGTFLRLLQKVEDGEKSQQVENSCVGNKKGKEEEEEEWEISQGKSSSFVSIRWLFFLAEISIFLFLIFFFCLFFFSTENSNRLSLSCAGFNDFILFLFCLSVLLQLSRSLSLSHTQLYFLRAIPPTSCSLLTALGGSGSSGSVQWLFSAFKGKDRHLAPKINK